MFCPRCGTSNPENTKFCRQCGLGLLQVSSYVATGGTAQLTPTPPSPVSQLAQVTAGYSPRQKMWLTILCLFFLPLMTAIIMGESFGLEEIFVPLMLMFMFIGIPWAVIHFRNQQRLLEQQQWQAQMQMQQMQPGASMPPLAPPVQQYLQPPMQPPIQMPVQQPMQQPYAPPVYQAPASNAPNTNPLGKAPLSVIEDETKRLPDQRG